MPKSKRTIIVILLFVLSIVGCARVVVRVNTYLDNEATDFAGSIYVIENPNPANPLLEKEVKSKIIKLLKARELTVVDDPSIADFYLTFVYGVNSGRTEMASVPVYIPGSQQTVTFNSPNKVSNINDPSATINNPASVGYSTQSNTVYDRGLFLYLVDGKEVRKSGKIKQIWISETKSTGSSGDIREVINYMLIPALKYYGESTGKEISETIGINNSSVKELKSK